ncbi:MAG: hypothetical protein QM726_11500 [Chitinophagaceae bacterium]
MLLTFLFLSFSINAQLSRTHRKENFDVHRFQTETIQIADAALMLPLKNMQGITVVDARADTAVVGFIQKKTIDPILGALNNAAVNQTEQKINRTPTFITLNEGLQLEVARYFKRTIGFPHKENLPGILMVIKKLWMSDELNLDGAVTSGNGRFAGPGAIDVWTSGVDVRIEFYLKDQESYYPLYRYDSVVTKAVTVSEYANEFIELALWLSIQKLKQMDSKIEAIKGRHKFSWQEIAQHNKDCFNMPALTDTVLRKGVYMTFEEFKNNNPSQTSFEIRKDKLIDVIYIKQNDGSDYAPREVWGYCDGENAYIKSANNFFVLQRSANAFYIFGAKSIKRTEHSNSGTPGYFDNSTTAMVPYHYNTSKTQIQLEPFQLDWSNGKLY